MKKINSVSIVIMVCFFLGCAAPGPKQEDAKQEIQIVYTDWSESIALTHLVQVLLERDLGYEVVLKLADIDQVFQDIASGDADLFTDAWVPSTHAEYLMMYEDRLEDLGPNYKNARTGLVVPAYMDIESIEDLRYMHSGPIAGIDSAAGIMQNTRHALSLYQLENSLLVLSDKKMSQMVENAIKRRQDIVFTGWEPHWLFHRYELKYLDDPKGVYMEQERIHTIARSGFSEDHPRAKKFFERMLLTEGQINSLLFEMKLQADPLIGVKKWIDKNEFTVNQWTRGLGKEREKIM